MQYKQKNRNNTRNKHKHNNTNTKPNQNKDFVTASVLVWLCFQAVAEELVLPKFLVDDLAAVSAVAEATTGLQRAVSVLRVSTRESLTHRAPDPLMVDHMLLHGGFAKGGKADDFVKKYNASVFYNPELILQDHAEKRQTNLLNENKITPRRKELLRLRVNSKGSWQASGLSLEILKLTEFWNGATLASSSNPAWQALSQTTEAFFWTTCFVRYTNKKCNKNHKQKRKAKTTTTKNKTHKPNLTQLKKTKINTPNKNAKHITKTPQHQHKQQQPKTKKTKASLTCATNEYFKQVDSGTPASASLFRSLSRRCAVWFGLQETTLRRFNLSQKSVDWLKQKVLRGVYDVDIDGILCDTEELDEDEYNGMYVHIYMCTYTHMWVVYSYTVCSMKCIVYHI